MPTRIASLAPGQRGLAVAAVLAVVLIVVAISSGGGGSGATGFHDPKLLASSLAYQSWAHSFNEGPLDRPPYNAVCERRRSKIYCRAQSHSSGPLRTPRGNDSRGADDRRATCPLRIGTTTTCETGDLPSHLTAGLSGIVSVTLTDGGNAYTAAFPSGETTPTDSIGGS